MSVSVSVSASVSVSVSVSVSICVYVHVWPSNSACVSVCVCVYVRAHVPVSIYVCLHLYRCRYVMNGAENCAGGRDIESDVHYYIRHRIYMCIRARLDMYVSPSLSLSDVHE